MRSRYGRGFAWDLLNSIGGMIYGSRLKLIPIMNITGKSWLDLYVDAMMEKDPYKRLALVRKLRSVPRQGQSDEMLLDEVPLRRASKGTRSGTRSRRG